MLQAILCDMDGTLIDTELANATAYCRSLSQYNIDISVHCFIEKYSGMAWRDFLPKINPSLTIHQMSDIATKKKNIYKELVQETKLNQNVIELVKELKHSKLIALVTTASRDATMLLLDYHKLDSLFDLIVTGDDIKHPKPSPEPYLTAAKGLNIDIKDCVILEDSEIGLSSARSSGATVLIVDHE